MQAVLLKDPVNYTIEEQRMVAEFAEFRELQALISEQTASAEQIERFQVLENRHTTGELRGYVSYLSDSPITFYILYGAIVAFYIIFGGFRAAVVTNLVQGVLIIVFSFILIPYGIIQLGGFSGLHQSVPAQMFSLFGTSALSEYTWYSIAAMILVAAVSVNGGFANMAAAGSARNEYDARIGVVTGAFGKRFMMMAWAIAGLIAYGLFRDQIAD
ncbi:hypothetical protein RZS08_08115, partial [Arthrospira platensis SPKY1]|nr:hypothetical protein [Arthrospira platensis SPKY1]